MSNTIIYQASTIEQVHRCAYSILKYLSVYNLKPPADHSLVVHTHHEASLELYGSFFSRFSLKPDLPRAMDESLFMDIVKEQKGNVLFISSTSYPIRSLEPVFRQMDGGKIFEEHRATSGGKPAPVKLNLMGRNERAEGSAFGNIQSETAEEFIAHYDPYPEFDAWLRYFFKRYQEESVPNQVKLIQHIDARTIAGERTRFLKQPLYTRLLQKIKSKAWKLSRYTSRT